MGIVWLIAVVIIGFLVVRDPTTHVTRAGTVGIPAQIPGAP